MSSERYENAPSGEVVDESYVSRSGNKNEAIPVQSDKDMVEDPIGANTADTDEQLARDDEEAIDKSNIIKEKTRHAAPQGSYQEPGDEEGLPDDTGRSANRNLRQS
ncbi:hypothetical protein BGZ63DRAFT_399854 [Mariannaea sp. PMI_226]|nr:hypothetical protein BGZ63DRAFT_399854 [Mariannaea sp. PMI_226]